MIAASILLGAVIGALTCSWLSEQAGPQGHAGDAGRGLRRRRAVVRALPEPGRCSRSDGSSSASRSAARPRPRRCTSPSSRRRSTGVGSCSRFQIAIGVGIVIATIVGASESIVVAAVDRRSPPCPPRSCWACCCGCRRARGGWSSTTTATTPATVLERVRPSGYDVDGELDEMAELDPQGADGEAPAAGPACAQRWVRPGADTRLRHRDLHPAQRHRDDHLLLPDDPDRQRASRADVALDVSVALGVSYLVAQLVGLTIIDRSADGGSP